MTKRRRFETALTTLVERVSPGDVRIALPKFVLPQFQDLFRESRKSKSYEVAF